MKLLNLGCGGERQQGEEWINLDDLHSQLPEGTAAREDLDAETNYVNFVIGSGPLPFEDESVDGVLLSHVVEHFDAQDGLKLLLECHRILKHGGVVLVSVPDASYFRRVYPEDRNANWPRLFDVSDPANPIPTFFEAAIWFVQHKMIFTEDALWAFLTRAGFKSICTVANVAAGASDAADAMIRLLNRRKFSLEMAGVK